MKIKHGVVITLLTLGFILGGQVSAQELDWRDIPIRDVLTGEMFKISDFEGTPILLEAFAVWCPTCTAQQNQFRRLHQAVGDDVISISLDVDPNEGANMVRDHATYNGFDWLYAISPPELTRALIQLFGTIILNAPSAPVILICEDQQETRLLGRGLKRTSKLLNEIASGCST